MLARREKQQGGVRVDMTPMVDIMMLLIIFFIMSTTFVVANPGFTVNLPAATADKQRTEQLDVLINREGQVAVNGQTMSKAEIPVTLIRKGVDGSTVVAVKADKAVSHGQVVEVMDAIRKAGVVKIAIAVEPKGT
ncbi:MAG TPA: biopolymer transporter ExbD [Negativicutes bacterium]|nr:biopolymer transporter ExbD [Negativicutes bacterium]